MAITSRSRCGWAAGATPCHTSGAAGPRKTHSRVSNRTLTVSALDLLQRNIDVEGASFNGAKAPDRRQISQIDAADYARSRAYSGRQVILRSVHVADIGSLAGGLTPAVRG